jgi:hypothetical protein
MCQYCGTKKHRKIYENHFGPIPKDLNGRTYDIHHIDGNHSNNDPNNLKAVSIQEHYDIHHAQEDYGACIALAKRMKITPEARAELARAQQLERSRKGVHHFLGGDISRRAAIDRVNNGTHNLLGPDLQKKRVAEGTHPFQGGEIQRRTQKRLKELGTHPMIGKTGMDHPKSDKNTYRFQNIITGEIVEGTRSEIKKQCALSDDALSKLILRKREKIRQWKLYC